MPRRTRRVRPATAARSVSGSWRGRAVRESPIHTESKPAGFRALGHGQQRRRLHASGHDGLTGGQQDAELGRHGRRPAQNVTGSAASPRRVRLWRNSGRSVARASLGSFRMRVLMAIWPSTRASGAPRQK